MIGTLQNTPVLTTERLVIRAPQSGDEAAFIPFATSARARWIGGGEACTEGLAWRFFSIIAGHWVIRGYGSFVYCDRATGTPIGSAGPWHPGNWPEQELGWTVWTPEYEGKGLAFEAMQTIRDYAYGALGWDTAVSYIAPDNLRSLALAKRLGCWHDEAAPVPDTNDPVQVFRHPSPQELAA